MKIIKLEAENVKRLRAVSIKPDGGALVVVGGRNGQGKSSTLDAIEMALGGSGSVPPRPIREGSSKARVVVDTGEIVVTRTFTAKGTQLVVTGKDGVPFGSPQTMLDKLVGELSFDPLEFSRMRSADQAAALKRVVGLDLSALDQEYARVYDDRTFMNRQVKTLEAQAAAIPIEEAPADEVSVAGLSEELEAALAANEANAQKRRGLNQNRKLLEQAKAAVIDLRKRLDKAEASAKTLEDNITVQEQSVAGLADADVAVIRDRIAGAESTNERVRRVKRRTDIIGKLDQAQAKSRELSERLIQIDAEKSCRLAEAKFPVRGLAFTNEGVTFNGLPFEQCCDSEKLKISVAMGLALNPELRVFLVRDGSLLDADSLKMVAEMAAAADAQVWLERVSEGDECSVVIEDGMVAAQKGGQHGEE